MADSHKKEKKRKRHSLDPEKANKRRSTGPDLDDIKITLSALDKSLGPVIAATPGLLLSSLSLNAYAKAHKTDHKDDTPAPGTHSILLHSSDHPLLDYTASSEVDQSVSDYVGVYDPSTRSLQIIPSHAVSVRSTLRAETVQVHADNELRSKALQREALGMEFGTKKAKRAIASKTVNAITGESAKGVESAILDSVGEATAGMVSKAERDEDVLNNKPIPPPNLSTDKVEDIYPLDRLIHKQDLKAVTVQDWIDKTKAGEEIMVAHRFVANRISAVVEQNNVQKLKALKYLLLLLEFTSILKPVKGGRKVPQREQLMTKLAAWPESLVNGVRQRFSQGGELPKWYLDNLMTHIAAISLYIDAYKTDTNDLREDLRMENKQMSQYFHELGCRIRSPTEKEFAEFRISKRTEAAQRKVAVLKLPLDFPKTRNPPKRR